MTLFLSRMIFLKPSIYKNQQESLLILKFLEYISNASFWFSEVEINPLNLQFEQMNMQWVQGSLS